MQSEQLTEPQIALLLKLHAQPSKMRQDYRPLQALQERDLVRGRAESVGMQVYELSPAGAALANQIQEERARIGRECTCGRQWSLKHDPQCLSRSGKSSPASS